MSVFNVFSLLGGLAMFLFGMSVMGDGLEKQAGGRLSGILQTLTSSRLKGLLLGVAVTAVIQSSSATTVMVVGFVNSGLMQLGQAIGVIMGANIGTTVTAWLLSLSGLEGDSLVVSLLKPTTFSPILAFIGILFYMFLPGGKKKEIGVILLGFAILMFGMDTMSGAVKPLADVPEFANILLLFSNPLLGVLTGALITAIIQSSSASVGILQALSATGSITYGAAVPIVLGQNIGTCVTAMISSVGANKNAKRTAMVHLYFNIVGSLFFLVAFYGLNAVLHFSFIGDRANAFGIAVTHTIFNVVSTAVMFPLAGLLEKLAYLTVRDVESDGQEEFQLLDERLLVTPPVAISRCRELTEEMAGMSLSMVKGSIALLSHFSESGAEQVEQGENRVDVYEDQLGTYLVRVAGENLSREDSRQVSGLLHTIGEFERISDHAYNIMEAAREIRDKNILLPDETQKELRHISGAVEEILDLAVTAFVNSDMETAKLVEPLEEVVDYLRTAIKSRQITRLQEGRCTIEMGFIVTDLLTDFERIADHCSNLALYVMGLTGEWVDPHAYLDKMTKTPQPEFEKQFQRFREKYMLALFG